MSPPALGASSIAACLALVLEVHAAPPKVTHLFPSGARQGDAVNVAIAGSIDSWPPGITVEGSGLIVEAAGEKGKLRVTVAAGAAPGVRWIRLHDAQGSATPRPFVVGTLPEVLETEPDDSPADARAIASPAVTVNGRLGRSEDVDCFAVWLERGQTLVAALDANRALGSPMDGILEVLSRDGFVLAEDNDEGGLDPRLVFTAPESGSFIVRLFAFPAAPSGTIGFAGGDDYVYRLTLTTSAFADFAFPLAVGPEGPARVELLGWNLPAGTCVLPVPRSDGLDDVVLRQAAVCNTASLKVVPHAALAESGPTSRDVPQAIPFPATVSGRIDPPGDVDVYALKAPKGQKILFTVESQRLGFPLDATLRFTDAAGKTLAEVDDTGDARDPELVATAPDDGEYRIEVRDLHGRGGPRFAYRLTAAALEPDFRLAVASDSFVLAPGKPLEVAVSIARRHGFNAEIELTAAGLPQGVEAAPVKSPAEGDASKSVKLVLNANASTPAASGPFRILGKCAGDRPLERAARAALPGADAFTEKVWLTVIKAEPPKPQAGS